MELIFPGPYKIGKKNPVPVFWDTDYELAIGEAKLSGKGSRLRAEITFAEMVLPAELMTSIQNNPNRWAIGTLNGEIRYLAARVSE